MLSNKLYSHNGRISLLHFFITNIFQLLWFSLLIYLHIICMRSFTLVHLWSCGFKWLGKKTVCFRRVWCLYHCVFCQRNAGAVHRRNCGRSSWLWIPRNHSHSLMFSFGRRRCRSGIHSFLELLRLNRNYRSGPYFSSSATSLSVEFEVCIICR